MSFRFSLRYRVALTFLIMGWLISMSMGGLLYWLTVSMEKELIEETLSTELEDFMRRYAINPDSVPPSSAFIQAYVINNESANTLPPELQQLPQGLSHIILDGSGYYVELREENATRFLLLYADKQITHRENQYFRFLALGIGLMTLLSSILGLWLAARVISPVTRLARQVARMGPDVTSPLLKQDHPYDEVGELTLAINGYHKRLSGFNERERAFTSDVSHELRTPLAVIEGATEVLLSKEDLDSDNRKRIERISRATKQMTQLTTALLALAREESENGNKHLFRADKVLKQVVNEHRYLLNHKPVEVELHTNNSKLSISGDPIFLYVVLANIVRNAFSYTNSGIVQIRMQENSILIEDTGTGIKEDQLLKMFERHYSGNTSRGGHGIGLSLVWRICERFGWKISVQSREDQGTSVKLQLARISNQQVVRTAD